MPAADRHRTFTNQLLAALKPLLTEQSSFGFSPNSFEHLCRVVDPDELERLEATHLLFQRVVPRISDLFARDASARFSQAMFEPVAVADDGLAIYVLAAAQAEDFATLRAALPRLEVDLATLAVTQHCGPDA
jgi:DNA-binding MurR/RpiR family transcriptional regulator